MIWSESWSTCDVCARLDGDIMPKPTKFCRLCDAHICLTDWFSPGRRIRAAVTAIDASKSKAQHSPEVM